MTSLLSKTAVLTLAALLVGGVGVSQAALKGVSQSVNPIGGFPAWVQDQNSLSLQACLEPANCILPLAGEEAQYDPAQALSFPTPLNFPSEHFYFYAESNVPITANSSGALVIMSVEAAFLPSIAPGNQNLFHRFRVKLDSPPENGVYTLLHPWGTTVFNDQGCTVGEVCTMTADLNLGLPPNFNGILGDSPEGSISTFLTQTNPVPAAGYLGDPNVAGPVTGGTVRNEVQIIAPSAAVIGTSTQFVVAGKKIGMDVNPSPAAPPVTTLVGQPVHSSIIVSNITGSPLGFTNVGALALAGVNAADFSIVPATDQCSGQTVPVPAAGPPVVTGTCSFEVQFNPAATTVAERTATLTITPDDTATAPPVSVSLTGTARYALSVTPATIANGTVAPQGIQQVNAGGAQAFTFTPATGYFPRVTLDGVLQQVTGNTFAVSGLADHHTIDVKFVRNGDVVENGAIEVSDAVRAMQIAVGVGSAITDDERIAADVGPLQASKPKADGAITGGDVLLILRRSIGLDPNW